MLYISYDVIFDKIVKARNSLKPEYSNDIRVMRAFKDILRDMEAMAVNRRGTKNYEDGYVWVVEYGGQPYIAYDDPERAYAWEDDADENGYSVSIVRIPRFGLGIARDVRKDDISKGE